MRPMFRFGVDLAAGGLTIVLCWATTLLPQVRHPRNEYAEGRLRISKFLLPIGIPLIALGLFLMLIGLLAS